MADAPKMLSNKEIETIRCWYDSDAEGRYVASVENYANAVGALLSHIAALNERIVALEKAGDAMLREQFDGYGILCGHCGLYTPTATQPKHTKNCPVPAWLSIRNAT